MTLRYTNEFINDARGIPHAVLDMDKSDFANDETATYGMKTSPVFAFRGKAGQEVITSQGENTETHFVCKGGEVVFANILPPDGRLDVYTPRDNANNPTGEQILKDAYDLIGGNLDDPRGGLFRPKPNPTKILLRVIKQPTVIANAYGPGNHVYLEPEATLKISGTSVSGINPIAFDATWALTDAEGNITSPARPPTPNYYNIERFQQILAR